MRRSAGIADHRGHSTPPPHFLRERGCACPGLTTFQTRSHTVKAYPLETMTLARSRMSQVGTWKLILITGSPSLRESALKPKRNVQLT